MDLEDIGAFSITVSIVCDICHVSFRRIVAKCKNNPDKALFFVRKVIQNSWGRNVLLNFLDTDLYEREGKAITNFGKTLPALQSDLAQQVTKDPYVFNFLTMTEAYNERELEDALDFGLLICKDKDNIEAQYSLEAYNLPLGISQYELSKLIPTEIKSTLPSIEEIESRLEQLSDKSDE